MHDQSSTGGITDRISKVNSGASYSSKQQNNNIPSSSTNNLNKLNNINSINNLNYASIKYKYNTIISKLN